MWKTPGFPRIFFSTILQTVDLSHIYVILQQGTTNVQTSGIRDRQLISFSVRTRKHPGH